MSTSVVGNTQWDGLPMPQRLWAILAITFGVTLSVLDASIANVALPTMAKELGVSEAHSIWVINAYQLVTLMSLLVFAAIGDIIGYRKVYLTGMAFFTASSLACALSHTFPMLVASRILQGLGSSALVSVNTSLVRIIYPKKHLGQGMGINSTVVAFSSVVGPTLAAGILAIAPWQWLFAINLPVGLIAIVLSYKFLPKNPVRDTHHYFSWKEGVANAFTFGLFIMSIEGYSHGFSRPLTFTLLGLFVVAAYVYLREERKREFPLLPIDLLKIPIFSLSVLTSICSFMAQMLVLVSMPFFLQSRLGYSASNTGLLMTAWPAIIVIIAPISGYLVERIHAGILGMMGLFIFAAGLFSFLLMPQEPQPIDIIWRLAVCGGGYGLFQSPNNSLIVGSAPAHRSGSASGMLAVARLVGQTTGASLVALLFMIFPENSTRIAWTLGGLLALTGALVSSTRIHLPLPEALQPNRPAK